LLVISQTVAYWLGYGGVKTIPKSTKQWKIPLGVRMISAGILMIGMLFLKESPCWLVAQGRDNESLNSLAHMRCEPVDCPTVAQEFAEIKAPIAEEHSLTRGATWKDCLRPGIRNRFCIIFFLMLCQQLTGRNQFFVVRTGRVWCCQSSHHGSLPVIHY